MSVEPYRGLPDVPPVETQRPVALLLPTVSGTAWAVFVPHLNGPVLTVGYHDDPSGWDFQHVPVHLIPVLVSFCVVLDDFDQVVVPLDEMVRPTVEPVTPKGRVE